MAVKPVVSNLASLQNESSAIKKINDNTNNIANSIAPLVSTNETSPFNVPLDMNGQRILNLPKPANPNDAVRLIDVPDLTPKTPGPKGDQGIQGIQGTKGDKGDQGVKGDVGGVGPSGPKGEQGVQGNTGIQGIQGNQGIQGLKGDKGDVGSKGDTGTGISLKGSVATPSNLPATGVTGDTYIITASGTGYASGDGYTWIGNGAESGTGNNWKNTGPLRGPKGDQGLKGDTGVAGAQGPQGIQGVKGDTGVQGVKGDTGSPGFNTTGDNYTSGTLGANSFRLIGGRASIYSDGGTNNIVLKTGTDAAAKYSVIRDSGNFTPAGLVELNGGMVTHSLPDGNIKNRVNSGFFQYDSANKAKGWPEDSNSWQHLISQTYAGQENYYALQFSGGFFDNDHFYARKTTSDGNNEWRELVHTGNISAYTPGKSFLDFIPVSIVNNYKAGGTVDLTSYLQTALNSGLDLFMPPNLPTVKISSTLEQKTANQVVEWFVSTPMIYNAPTGSRITPAWIIRETATGAVLRGLNVDHNSDGSRYLPPSNGQIAIGNTILTMADSSLVENCVVRNAWDNGIGIGKFDLVTGAQTNATPAGATVRKAQTFNCGIGYHPTGEQAGSGVNILCGSNSLVTDCIDIGSLTGFIGDYASGAGGVFFACKSKYAKTSATPSNNNGVVTPGNVQGGYGFYSGANHLAIVACFVEESAQAGYWIDGFSFDVHIKGCAAKACRKQSVLFQGGFNTLEDFTADSSSYTNQGVYPAIEVKGTWADGAGYNSSGLILSNIVTKGTYHHTGIIVTSDSGRTVNGYLNGGYLNGTVSPFNNNGQPGFLAFGYRTEEDNTLKSYGRELKVSKNINALSAAFGDFANNGSLILADATDTRKRLAMGYDPDRDRSVIQSIQAAVATRPLEINPSGGDVLAYIFGVGLRRLEAGAADSAGTGYRTLRISN